MIARSGEPSGFDADAISLSQANATRLLRLGLGGTQRPVDQLIDRLSQSDGNMWLTASLRRGPVAAFGPPQKTFVDGSATLDQLVAIKQTSKTLLKSAVSDDGRLDAMVGYFFSIAAAALYHHRLICSRNLDELRTILLDLASACDAPWADFIAQAAIVPDAQHFE